MKEMNKYLTGFVGTAAAAGSIHVMRNLQKKTERLNIKTEILDIKIDTVIRLLIGKDRYESLNIMQEQLNAYEEGNLNKYLTGSEAATDAHSVFTSPDIVRRLKDLNSIGEGTPIAAGLGPTGEKTPIAAGLGPTGEGTPIAEGLGPTGEKKKTSVIQPNANANTEPTGETPKTQHDATAPGRQRQLKNAGSLTQGVRLRQREVELYGTDGKPLSFSP